MILCLGARKIKMYQKYAVIIRTRDVLKKIQAIERSSRMPKRFFSVRCNNGSIKKE